MKPGLYDLPADKYHADPADEPSLSCGVAKIMLAQSPAHVWQAHPRLNKAFGDENNKDFDVGTAAHSMLLEGVDNMEVCYGFDSWRKKEAQEFRDSAYAHGKVPLLEAQYETVQAMVSVSHTTLLNCPDINLFWPDGKPEQTVIWTEDDIWLRCRPDWLSNDRKLILDYKTTKIASPAAWMRAIPGNGYDVQDAFYRRGVEAVTGVAPEFVFIVQETFEPYAVYFVELPASYRAIGEQKVETAIAKWRECMKSGKWPAYPPQIMMPEPPAWAMAEAEELAAERAGWTVEGFMFGKVRDEK